jgi:hypothetical protein
MAYYYNPNIPLHLDAASLIKFKYNKEIIALNRSISKLTN